MRPTQFAAPPFKGRTTYRQDFVPHDLEARARPQGTLAAAPEALNQDAYAAWLIRLQPDDPADLDGLLDAEGYRALVEPT